VLRVQILVNLLTRDAGKLCVLTYGEFVRLLELFQERCPPPLMIRVLKDSNAIFCMTTMQLGPVNTNVEATLAYRTEEVDATRMMIERVERQFDLTPKRS
jgi:hypothetical protein